MSGSTGGGRPPSSLSLVLAAVAAVTPLLYIGLTLVLGATWPGYDPVRDTQSELGALDAPLAPVMNVAGFMGLGVAILCFAGAYALTLKGGWMRWAAVVLLAIAGIGMVVVGFFPCDPGCVDVTTGGRLHGASSSRARSSRRSW